MFKTPKKKRLEREKNAEHQLLTNQIARMVQFMELEGKERAALMDLRAEEEFHIIKAELINYQRRVMSTMYAKKYNALEIESTTEISKLRNQGRVRAFKEKSELISEIVKEITQRVVQELEANRMLYTTFLVNLYLQALCTLMRDGEIFVVVRESDKKIADGILHTVIIDFKNLTGKQIKLTVCEDTFLEDDSLGGALFTSGRISVSSTIRQRIQDVIRRATPYMRSVLFGPNVRRKFFY